VLNLIGSVLALLLLYFKNKDPKWKRSFDENMREFDKALADGDADAISLRFNELRLKAGVNLGGKNGNADRE